MRSASLRQLGVIAVLFAIGAMPAFAQRPVELGADMGLTYTTDSPHLTTFSLPIGDVRAGFFLSDQFSFEPRISLSYFKVEGSDATTLVIGTAGVLYHFSPDRSRSQVFVRPFVEWRHLSVGSSSASQTYVGGALGIKLPAGSRLAARLELGFNHGFENDNFAKTDEILANIGISFFTR